MHLDNMEVNFTCTYKRCDRKSLILKNSSFDWIMMNIQTQLLINV